MASFGKKLLSAFVEVSDSEPTAKETASQPQPPFQPPVNKAAVQVPANAGNKFHEHFNRLFAEANLPDPNYYEFTKMTEAMHMIPDEKSRFCAAFAGLQVQGLDKQKLLASAKEYLQLLATDAAAFHQTIDSALTEKVQSRKKEVATKQERIQSLSQEISDLQQQIVLLSKEVAENEAKIDSSTAGYDAAAADRKNRLMLDIEKINQYLL